MVCYAHHDRRSQAQKIARVYFRPESFRSKLTKFLIGWKWLPCFPLNNLKTAFTMIKLHYYNFMECFWYFIKNVLNDNDAMVVLL